LDPGFPRFLCVIICFTGSGLLHCVPQYFSTGDWKECGMMFSFFFLHGLIVLVESAFGQVVASLYSARLALKVPLPQPVITGTELVRGQIFSE
jgi:hypothetical protein